MVVMRMVRNCSTLVNGRRFTSTLPPPVSHDSYPANTSSWDDFLSYFFEIISSTSFLIDLPQGIKFIKSLLYSVLLCLPDTSAALSCPSNSTAALRRSIPKSSGRNATLFIPRNRKAFGSASNEHFNSTKSNPFIYPALIASFKAVKASTKVILSSLELHSAVKA